MGGKVAKQLKWGKIGNNYVMEVDPDHYISYNPDTGSDHLGALMDSLIGDSGEETALIDPLNPDHEYRILHGDWRDEYEKLATKGFEDCVDFFVEKRAKHGGQWSTHEKDRASL